MWHTTPANGATVPWRASGQSRVTFARPQRQSDPDTQQSGSSCALVCELDMPTWSCVSCRVVSHCITPRPRLSSPTGSCQTASYRAAPQRNATQRTSHSHRLRHRHRHTAQHNTVPALSPPRCCVSATSCHLCSHPDPLRLPGFQGFTSGGALLRNQPPPPPLPSALSPSLPFLGRTVPRRCASETCHE